MSAKVEYDAHGQSGHEDGIRCGDADGECEGVGRVLAAMLADMQGAARFGGFRSMPR